MKTLLKVLSASALLFLIPGCDTGEEALPVVDSTSFNESELTTMIDNLITQSKPENPVFARVSETANAMKSLSPVIDPINGGIEVGKSKLLRNVKGVAWALKSHLVPGHAYTIWWVIWNHPENCMVPGACVDADFANAQAVGVDVIYAGGNVADRNGVGTFAGHLRVGDTTGSINPLFELGDPIGMLDAKKAELHLLVRSHGPKIPGQVRDQISSFEGGCTVFFDPFTEIPDEVGECGEVQFAIFSGS